MLCILFIAFPFIYLIFQPVCSLQGTELCYFSSQQTRNMMLNNCVLKMNKIKNREKKRKERRKEVAKGDVALGFKLGVEPKPN